jgi:ATP-binding cassette, subfamily B, bacterial
MDCGPTCLHMVQRFHGGKYGYNQILAQSELDKNGTNFFGLSTTAERMGFKTLTVKINTIKLIAQAPLPAILHWEQNHFVVISPKSTLKKIIIADPAHGKLVYSKEEFESKWIQNEEGTGIALLLEPTDAFYKGKSPHPAEEETENPGWAFLLKYASPFRRYYFQLLVGLLIATLLQVVVPFLTQSIVDVGIQTRNLHYIQLILFAQLFLFAGRTVAEFIRSQLLLFISTRLNLSILSDFWRKLMQLPIAYFDVKQTGDTLQRIGDHHRLQNFITASSLNTIFSMFSLLVFSIILLGYNSMVFMVFAAGSVLYIAWIVLFLSRRKKLDVLRFGVAGKENTATMQLVQGMQEIKLNQCEQRKRNEWEGLQSNLFDLQFKMLYLGQYQQAGAFFINEGKNILITFFTATAVLNGQLTLGAMLAIQYIVGQLNSPVEQLISFIQQAQDAKLSLDRIGEIHNLRNEDDGKEDQVHNANLHKKFSSLAIHSIQLEQMGFTYPGSGNPQVLHNVSMHIPTGKVTAIVGMSGSGKTTLLKLLMMYYPNYTGQISLTPHEGGSTSFKHIQAGQWRKHCAAVLQDGFIFNDTIAGNIAPQDAHPDREKLLQACRIANILSFVEGLPNGFRTKIGPEGVGISQGQRQRILIARAIYRNPDFIFFDEATNALDANNEKEILAQLADFFKGRTVVVVAHRLSTVIEADQIVVLHQGEIAEIGNHASLSAKKGRYYELVRNQLELGN